MNKRFILGFMLVGGLLTFESCSNSSTNEKAGGKPIVLGDPSTIVTETDSNYLKDMVVDLKPSYADIPRDTIQAPAQDTAKKADSDVIKKAQEQTTGLTIAFKDVTIFIPGVEAKLAGKNQDLQKVNSATYQLTDGKIEGNKLQISGATISRVSQRYQSTVSIKNNLGTLALPSLGSTSSWKTITGANNTYTISGLAQNQLAAGRVNQSTLRNAINTAGRQRRMNSKTIQQWQNSVKGVRSANQKPLVVALRAVMWKIDGKGANGKSFSKQVRIDL